jgi:pyridoxine 5-phosphate synthase
MKLGVNIDHVATLRQARGTLDPDPVDAALAAERGGADSIVCHLREDRRHIQDRDLRRLRQAIRGRLNLEMAMTEEIVGIALEIKPDQVTLVPERRQERTTEGGLEVAGDLDRVRRVVGTFREGAIPVSLFVEADEVQIRAARDAGAGSVEIHTGHYSNLAEVRRVEEELRRIGEAARLGREIGLFVAAGHGLNLANVAAVACIEEIEEFNIGHSIVGRAVFVGIEQAVREMKIAIAASRGG